MGAILSINFSSEDGDLGCRGLELPTYILQLHLRLVQLVHPTFQLSLQSLALLLTLVHRKLVSSSLVCPLLRSFFQLDQPLLPLLPLTLPVLSLPRKLNGLVLSSVTFLLQTVKVLIHVLPLGTQIVALFL